jgi:hypothetical protein
MKHLSGLIEIIDGQMIRGKKNPSVFMEKIGGQMVRGQTYLPIFIKKYQRSDGSRSNLYFLVFMQKIWRLDGPRLTVPDNMNEEFLQTNKPQNFVGKQSASKFFTVKFTLNLKLSFMKKIGSQICRGETFSQDFMTIICGQSAHHDKIISCSISQRSNELDPK